MSTAWTLTDDGNQTYTIDSINASGGEILFRLGQEITRTFVFHTDSDGGEYHTDTYERLKENYGRHLTDNTVLTTETHRGVPRYTQNINPISNASSYLFKLEPGSSLDMYKSWWVVITAMEDDTTMIGPAERLSVTLYPLTPADGQTRAEIVDEYEVD